MPESRRCPDCGTEIPPHSPQGLCPKCVLKGALEIPSVENSGRAVTEGSARETPAGFIPPTVAELSGRFPQLEILELVGKGGMGAVYKARQRGLDRLVALKILPPDIGNDAAFAERFTREARALARLNHPHIVGVYDFGQADGLYYFVMEFVDGVNLRQAIHSGSLQAKDALAIVPQICDALQFAHDEGIVHRDIKPENILIDKKGRVKIADFGLAKLLGQEQPDHHLTATHQVMGTIRYMAPEQMEGSRAVDHRADIYSLGVVFYEMLTGEVPVGRFALPSQMVQLDVRLDEVVLRSLEREPQRRYQHASEVKMDVEMIVSENKSLGLAAQKPVQPAKRTASAEPLSLPFTITESVYWGWFGKVHGKLRMEENALVVEFEVRSLLPFFRSGVKEVRIPFDDIESITLDSAWISDDLTIRTYKMSLLADIPTSSQGKVELDVACTDFDRPGGVGGPAKQFLAALPRRLAGDWAVVQPAPPAPEAPKSALTELDIEAARDQVRGPAIGLLITGIIQCAVTVFLFLMAALSTSFIEVDRVSETTATGVQRTLPVELPEPPDSNPAGEVIEPNSGD
ncbi:MAG: protein kinase domain-containing protein [Pirellulaceae bacterium]